MIPSATGRLAPGLLVLAGVLFQAAAIAADKVYLLPPGALRDPTVLSGGEIKDYSGAGLVYQSANGNTRRYPASHVQRVETQWLPEHRRGDELFGKGKLAEALAAYREAQRRETRRWVRRRLMAEQVWCLQNLGQWLPAAELFLALYSEDPQTPYFECIPMAWAPMTPQPPLVAKAQGWLANPDGVLVVLGASYLMHTPLRARALSRVNQLRFHRDGRVAALATALWWQGRLHQVEPEGVKSWEQDLRRFPPRLRVGGHWVLAQAHTRLFQPQRSVLHLLRIPVLYPRHRLLAARALLQAAEQLQRVGQHREATRLLQELAIQYDSTPEADQARQMLRQQADPSR